MKIMFVNLPYEFPISRTSRWPEKTKSGTLYYPYWLCYAAGVCIEKKYEVTLIDCIAKGNSREDCITQIGQAAPRYLVCEITTPTSSYDFITIEEIKKRFPETIIIVGGTHATALHESVMKRCDAIDIIARQEYEYTVVDIVESQGEFNIVSGITYRDEKGEIIVNPDRPWNDNLDDLPMVSKVYEKFLNVNDYGYSLAEFPMVQIFSARGCPFRCNFCSYPETMGGRAYRKRSVSNFVDEIEYVSKNMPYIKEIFIEDDTFTVDKKRVYEICLEIINRGLRVKWSCNTRADLPEKLMKVMKIAGCRLLVVGFESGNQHVLDETKKGIKLEESENFMRAARNNNLKVFGCFMIGLKGDNLDTIEQTYRFAKKIYPDMVFFQQAVPFPNTEFYEWTKTQGYLITEDYSKWLNESGQLRCLVNYPYATVDEIERIRDKMMSRYYFNPYYFVYTLTHNMNSSEFSRIVKGGVSYVLFRIKKILNK